MHLSSHNTSVLFLNPAFFFCEVQMSHTSKQKADPAQETAIHHVAGPCAVIAGPGSGKTFVLVERIRYLIETVGVDPSSVLVLTFSRAAAAQMRRRFLESCGHTETVFGTFHSVFFRILQEGAAHQLHLIDPQEKQAYLQHLCRLHPAFLPKDSTPEELQLLISRYKNGLLCRQEWAAELAGAYDAFLDGRNQLDFDDMILRCRKLLTDKPEALNLWRQRFKWILVDEFQDVSPAQYDVLCLLAAPANNLFVVGDDDQSIYGFRGADPGIMRRFLKDFKADTGNGEKAGSRQAFFDGTLRGTGENPPGARVIFLSANYRCGSSILEAADSLIRCNTFRIDKDFRAGSDLRGRFLCRPFSDRVLQYSFIGEELQHMTPADREKSAVIFRTHSAAGQFLRILAEKGVPFSASGVTGIKPPVTGRMNILLDLTAYYRAAAGICSGTAARDDLLRIMNRPERFLSGAFIAEDHNCREAMEENAGFEQPVVKEMLGDLAMINALNPLFSIRYLLDSVGYRSYVRSAYKDAAQFLDEIEEESRRFRSCRDWVCHLESLFEDEKEKIRDRQEQGVSAASVRILTMHACKGLEFDRVFIPDLNEGSIPSKRAWTPEQVEEERRLLYVAMTRARSCLTITYLEGTPDRPAAPSRFLIPLMPGR